MTLSAADALRWANGKTIWPAGLCLNFVWNAYGRPAASPVGGYPNALAGWANTRDKRAGRNAPAGTPVYFTGGKDGHVALSKGDGVWLRSTYTSGGVGYVGDIRIDQIVNGWGRQLLGWGADAFGHDIELTASAGGGSQPLPPIVTPNGLEFDMFRIIPFAKTNPLQYWIVGLTGKRVMIGSPAHLTLLRRFQAQQGGDQMFADEANVVADYLRSVNP